MIFQFLLELVIIIKIVVRQQKKIETKQYNFIIFFTAFLPNLVSIFIFYIKKSILKLVKIFRKIRPV